MATNAAQPSSIPTPRRTRTSKSSSRTPQTASSSTTTPQSPKPPTPPPSNHSSSTASTTVIDYTSGSSYHLDTSTATASVSPTNSLSSLRHNLPETPHVYDFSEIRSATNNFLSKRHSATSSTPSWRCSLRGKDVVIFQRKFRRKIDTSELKSKLYIICRSHHMSIIKLLGVSLSGHNNIYLVYEYIPGANLVDCLRNPRNPNFTVLPTWMSRMQVATDLSHGLDYIHNNTGLDINLVHKHVKSSSVIVTEPSFNAKICHFGTAELCGEAVGEKKEGGGKAVKGGVSGEIVEEEETAEEVVPVPELRRVESGVRMFEGVRGYMSPEFQATGVATQKSDVYSFGIVILELLSGVEPLRYKFDRTTGEYRRICIIMTAKAVINGNGGGEGEREGRMRRWVDRRLNDSFPVDVAEKMTRVALECVDEEADKRPNMRRVAGKISKLYLESRIWSDKVRVPTDISLSLGPR